jgi:hypothetical protein
VVAAVVADPAPHLGRIYELTGSAGQNSEIPPRVEYSLTPEGDGLKELLRPTMPEYADCVSSQ